MHLKNNPQSGFMALTSVLILVILMVAVSLSLANSSLTARYNHFDFNLKKITYFLAQSCLEQALLKLSADSSYAGNEVITLTSGQCAIVSVQTSGSNKIIQARAQIGNATTNLKLTVLASNLSTVSLEQPVKF